MVDAATTWFQVSKVHERSRDASNPWAVRYRTLNTLSSVVRSAWFRDFATKDEAVAAGLAKGWVQVETWNEARRQAAPILEERRAAHQKQRDAREGLVEIKIGKEQRWVSEDIADLLLLVLGDGDENKVVRVFSGDEHSIGVPVARVGGLNG